MKQQYKSYRESQEFLIEAQKRYPNLIRIINIGKSWEGRDILLATLSLNVEYADLKPLFYIQEQFMRESGLK